MEIHSNFETLQSRDDTLLDQPKEVVIVFWARCVPTIPGDGLRI
jgi:hypothetical protein